MLTELIIDIIFILIKIILWLFPYAVLAILWYAIFKMIKRLKAVLNEKKAIKYKSKIKIHKTEPSFEEWKQARGQNTEPRQETSTYRLVGSQIPKDDTVIYKKPEPKVWTPPVQEPEREPIEKPIPNERMQAYQNAYEATNILTKNERNNYKNLKIAADKKGYMICPKVRLADIVKPRNDPQYMSRFGKIKSKHLDFVIYDSEMRNLKVVIELDDNSHNRADRQERDEFVDFVLNDCGIKIIHTRYITPDILDDV